jgi:flagellar protein FlgJ
MRTPIDSEKATLLLSDHLVKRLSQTAKQIEKKLTADQQLREVTQEFESLFLHYLMKTMRTAAPQTDLFHGGQSEEIFTDMLDQEIAKAASKRGIGIADMLYHQLRRMLYDEAGLKE